MITLELFLKQIKLIGVIVVTAFIVWLWQDRKFQKTEKERQTENASGLRKADSLHYTGQILTQRELNDYLLYQNSDLRNKLDKSGIKTNRVESIVSNNYYYKDTTSQFSDVSPLVKSILEGRPDEQKFQDTTKCLKINGGVVFDGKTLKVKVDDREFKNKSDAVAYWERRQWKFLFIKSRLFGKKEFTAKTFDECGESRIMKIEKKK